MCSLGHRFRVSVSDFGFESRVEPYCLLKPLGLV